MLFDRPEAGRRTLLLQVELRQQANPDAQELAELARSAELVVATVAAAKRDAPHPRWFIGSGKVDELKQMLAFHDADIVLVNSYATLMISALMSEVWSRHQHQN